VTVTHTKVACQAWSLVSQFDMSNIDALCTRVKTLLDVPSFTVNQA